MSIQAKFQADFTSFNKAVEDAEAKLKSFEQDAHKVETSLSRMSDRFSGVKVIQQATLMAKAIENVGGVTALTEKELQQVGAVAQEAASKFKALGIGVPKQIQAIADAAKAAEKPVESMGISFAKLVASFVSAQAILGTIKSAWNTFTGIIVDSVKAAGDAEKANAQLVAALRAQGTATPSVVKAFEDYASALQKTTIYQDDAIEGAEALLVTVGNVMPRDMKKALDATTNLASGLGVDLTTAALQVAKAAEGNTTALKKAGIVIDETKAKSEGFGYVLDEINKKFGGQSEALANTYQGRLQQLANTFNNVEESIGRVITTNATVIAALNLLNKAIDGNTGELNQNATANELVSDAVIGVAKAVSASIQAANYLQIAYYDLRIAADALFKPLLNIGIAVLDSAKAIGTATKYINPVSWTQTWKQGMAAITETSDVLKGMVQGFTADQTDASAASEKWNARLTNLSKNLDGAAAHLQETRGQTKAFNDNLKESVGVWQRQTKAVVDSGDAQKKAAKAIEDLTKQLREIEGTRADVKIKSIGDALSEIGGSRAVPTMKDLDQLWVNNSQHLEALEEETRRYEKQNQQTFDALARELEGTIGLMPDLADRAKQHIEDLEDTTSGLGSVFKGVFGQLNSIFERAFEGGGGIGGAIKSLATNLVEGFTSLIPVVGPAISKFAGTIVAAFSKLFGKSEESLKVNAPREAFVQAAGGLAKLNEQVYKATGSLKLVQDLLNAKTANDYAKAVENINEAFADFQNQIDDAQQSLKTLGGRFDHLHQITPDLQKALNDAFAAGNINDFSAALGNITGILDEQEAKQNHLNDLIEKYGLNWENASQSFKQSKINDLAVDLIDDFNTLKDVFPDLNVLMRSAFGDNLEDFVLQAKRAGAEIPEDMKPIIQAGIDSGKLFDENGNKITDMAQLGLHFGQTMQKVTSDLTDAIKKLTEIIEKQFAGAFENAANKAGDILKKIPRDIDVNVNVHQHGDTPGGHNAATGGYVTATGIQHFAKGGWAAQGTDTVPAMLTPGELILNKKQQDQVFGDKGATSSGALVNKLLDGVDKLKSAFSKVKASLTDALGDSLTTFVQQAKDASGDVAHDFVPIIDAASDTGKALTQSGTAINQLSDAGAQFGDTMQDVSKAVTSAFGSLAKTSTLKLAKGFSTAAMQAQEIAESVPKTLAIDVEVKTTGATAGIDKVQKAFTGLEQTIASSDSLTAFGDTMQGVSKSVSASFGALAKTSTLQLAKGFKTAAAQAQTITKNIPKSVAIDVEVNTQGAAARVAKVSKALDATQDTIAHLSDAGSGFGDRMGDVAKQITTSFAGLAKSVTGPLTKAFVTAGDQAEAIVAKVPKDLTVDVGVNTTNAAAGVDKVQDAFVGLKKQMKSTFGDALTDFVRQAKKAGMTVPNALKPVITTAMKTGKVFDANSSKLADLSDQGADFGMTLKGVTQSLTKSFGSLAKTVDAKFGKSLDNAVEQAQNVNKFLPKSGGASGGWVGMYGVQGFAKGGWASSDTVPAMLTPGELVLNKQQQEALLSGGGDLVVHTHIELEGRQVAESVSKINDRKLRQRRKLSAA